MKKFILSLIVCFNFIWLCGCSQNGKAQSSAKLSEDEALKIVLEDCSLQKSDIKGKNSALDTENGILVYDIEFYSGNYEYDYEVDANTGKIISRSKEVNDDVPITANGNNSAPQSSAPQQNSTDPAQKTENTAPSTEKPKTNPPTTNPPKTNPPQTNAPQITQSQPNSSSITLEKAKEIALKDVGISAAAATFSEEKRDFENGVEVFELEFYTEAYVYDYEIDVKGNIISKEAKSREGGNASQYITYLEALEIALNHAGVKTADAEDVNVDFDGDKDYDDKPVYEVEFCCGSYEYDYEIDAVSGEIIKSEKEIRN